MCVKLKHAKIQLSSARKTFSNLSWMNGIRKNVRFQEKTGHISEMVKDAARVTN